MGIFHSLDGVFYSTWVAGFMVLCMVVLGCIETVLGLFVDITESILQNVLHEEHKNSTVLL